jgi:predicted secreted protein
LAYYRSYWDLPSCTTANGCFRKVDQNGGTTYPSTAVGKGWDGEIALDIDMVSAICPYCHILLVEATNNQLVNLGTGVNTAVSLGAVAVSNSYSGPDSSSDGSYDALYYNHPGVAITASTGDCGYNCSGVYGSSDYNSVGYPAASPDVVAVGGTSLTPDVSARGWTESAWGDVDGGAGSGCSVYEPKPSWQQDTECANRTEADVSAVADPETGVWIYVDGGWGIEGGTSAASPIIAATFALAGGPAAGTYPASYLYADTADLNDVIGGNNDVTWGGTGSACTVSYLCNGVAGYDGPTGLGTPNGVTAFMAVPHLAVAGLPSPTVAGVAHSLTVTAKDAYGNTATGYTGKVHFTSSDPAAVLPADATLTDGVGTFSVTLKTAGTRSVTATDTVTPSITGSQSAIVVNPGSATHLAVSGLPSPTVAGVAHNLTVTARDAYGNTATGYTGSVHFTSSDPAAALPANAALTAGVGTFSVTLRTAGTRSVTATDTVTPSITGSQNAIVVNPGSATQLTVSGLPSPYRAGSAQSLTVTARDAYGNTATGYTGSVHFTSSDSAAILPVNYTFTSGDAGTHTFSVTLKSAGSQSVTATDTVTPSIKGSQSNIVVNYPASTYVPTSPRRVLDSRPTGSGHTNIGLAGKFTAGVIRKFSVAGAKYVGGGSALAVPANAVAVTGNLTIVGETAAGVVDLGPTVSATGSTTTINFVVGDTRANNVTLGLAGDGSLEAVYRISSVGATTDLIFDVTGYFLAGTTGATYHSLVPGRVLDTRPTGSGVTHIGPLTKLPNKAVKTFPVAGVKGLGWSSALVPSNATAVTGNLTVTGATSAGFVSVGPTMTSSPSTSSVNVAAGTTVANGVTVALSGGKLQVVWCGTTGSSANVIFDVTGYFSAGSGGLSFYALTPVRVLDSSTSLGLPGPFASGTAQLFTIGGTAGVPTGVAGISGNLTVLTPTSGGWALVSPEIVPTPTTSTLNVASGHSEANGFDVSLGASGHVSLEWAGTSASTANIVLDITGYWG